MWQIFPLESAEWQNGSARAPQASGEISSFCSSLLLQTSILLHYCPPPAPVCVCMWGSFWLFGCGSTADCIWNKLSINNSSNSLMSLSLLTPPCSEATCCRMSSTLAHLFQAGLLLLPVTGERSRHFSQSEVCTASSPFCSSICMEASAASGVDGADTPAWAAAFALRWVATILPWGSGKSSVLDLCKVKQIKDRPKKQRTALYCGKQQFCL